VNTVVAGTVSPPRFAETPLDRQSTAPKVEGLWVLLLPQPSLVHLIPGVPDSVCSVDTKSS